MKAIQYATTDSNSINWDNPQSLLDDLSFFNGALKVTIEDIADTVTTKQLRGYFGVIIPDVISAMEQVNYEFPVGINKKDAAHFVMKAKFLSIRDDKGTLLYIKDFHDLNVHEIEKYWDSIIKYWGERGFEIRLPEKPFENETDNKAS